MKMQTLVCVLAFAAAGCASSGSRELDQKISQEPPVESRRQVQTEADQKIATDSQLTPDQKARLSALRTSVSAQLDDVSRQSLKLRSVLIEEILSPNYSLEEVSLIKSRLKKLEDKRLSLMFDGVDEANKILGRHAPQNRRMIRELLEDRTATARD